MKKTKFMLATLLLLPSLVLVRSSLQENMTGGYIKPSTGQGGLGGSCQNACAYYIGFTQDVYMTTGLRVTFYDTNGNQVGNFGIGYLNLKQNLIGIIILLSKIMELL